MREAQAPAGVTGQNAASRKSDSARDFWNSQSALQNSARGNAPLFPKSDEPLQLKPSYYIVGDVSRKGAKVKHASKKRQNLLANNGS
jgi:hypothetical protein